MTMAKMWTKMLTKMIGKITNFFMAILVGLVAIFSADLAWQLCHWSNNVKIKKEGKKEKAAQSKF